MSPSPSKRLLPAFLLAAKIFLEKKPLPSKSHKISHGLSSFPSLIFFRWFLQSTNKKMESFAAFEVSMVAGAKREKPLLGQNRKKGRNATNARNHHSMLTYVLLAPSARRAYPSARTRVEIKSAADRLPHRDVNWLKEAVTRELGVPVVGFR